MTRIHAFTDDALGDLDAVGVAESLRAGSVSPREVLEAAIARVEQVDPELNAMAHPAYDRARTGSGTVGDSFLAGVPTVVKDNCDVAGMPTMNGADAWDPTPAKKDGDWARMYLGTGLVNLGKSQLSEYGFSAAAEHPRLGPVRSPWDTTRIAGASSSGAAGLVASGALPIAHANDGGGSIRIPASVNGLVGLKPTRGRFAQDQALRTMPVRIISDGVLTRSVRDTAVFCREAEKVFRDVELPPIGDIRRPGKKRLTVALNTTGVARGADPEVTALTEGVARRMEELGHRVVEVEPPVYDGFEADFLLYWGSLSTAMLSTGRLVHGSSWRRDRHDNLTLGLDRHVRRNLHRLPGAIRRLRRSAAIAAEFYETYDVTLTPVLAHPTPEVGHLDPTQDYDIILERLLDWVAFTPLQNATGTPAISLPLATTADGLPQGMMFGAGAGDEALLLELALELEEAAPFARITDS
ncbi:amidase [Nocardioides panacisoli]|uniref:amidase n=1 Tax=Nocardioides panacisoli TaxID=627624 RepID=UPI001C62D7B1|nr:amidase [Nocardioides panacisoli]QYJ03830.1 amidase [Nocardioides panacisoli]